MVHRVQSWQNYAALFTALIEDEDGSKVRYAVKSLVGFDGVDSCVSGVIVWRQHTIHTHTPEITQTIHHHPLPPTQETHACTPT